MALKRNERYPLRFANPTPAHPQGAFKNRTSPTSQDGSYLESDWANDWDGFFARLMTVASVTPNGNVDTGTSSQYYDALMKIALQRSNPFGDIKSDGSAAISTALDNLGLGDIATSTDIINGASKKIVDSAGLKSFLPKRAFASNDFVRIPDVPGGLIIQWGTVNQSTPEGVKNVVFPTPFPNFALIAMATPSNLAANTGIDVFSQLGAIANSNVNFFFSWVTTATPADGFRWFALGY